MKKLIALSLLICIFVTAFKKVGKYSFPVPAHWGKPSYNFANNLPSTNKTQLGRALFYDPILSSDSTISCASCHSQYSAFTHIDHALSHGIAGRMGKRNSPALMNLAWQSTFMWDGSVEDLDKQAKFPISHPDEMGEQTGHVVNKLRQSPLYRKLFYDAFGDSAITEEHMLKAIAQFMVTLVSAESKYDSVQRKEAKFTDQEANGYKLFKQHCAACHTEPLFTNHSFESNGLPPDTALNDNGRMKVTHSAGDSLKFKVPTLRNIEFSSPYMHDGRFKRLNEVLNHYTAGIQKGNTTSEKLRAPIVLSSNEKVDIIAFLLTLTDKHFIFNPELSYPKNIFSQK